MTAKPNGQDEHHIGDLPAGAVKAGRASLRPLLALKPYLLRYSTAIAAALVALLVSAAATLVLPIAVRRMIDVGFSGMEPGLVDKYFTTLLGVGLILALASAARFSAEGWPANATPCGTTGAVGGAGRSAQIASTALGTGTSFAPRAAGLTPSLSMIRGCEGP